jgi:membrane protease YdiL (CAAX protease family)
VTVATQPAEKPPPAATGRSTSIWLFFVLAFDVSWPFWIMPMLLGLGIESPNGLPLIAFGFIGPLVAGIFFAWHTRSDGSWSEYWARLRDPRRIPARWYAVIVLFMPAMMAFVVLWDMAFETGSAFLLIGRRAAVWLDDPSSLVPLLLTTLLLGPLLEEFGWRGYALDRLQARFGAAIASLVLGVLWALWHLPLFFIRDTFQSDVIQAWSPAFWMFVVQIVAMSFVMTWIFNHTERSTLGAILFRVMASLALYAGNVSDENTFLLALFLLIVAIVIAFRHRAPARAPATPPA